MTTLSSKIPGMQLWAYDIARRPDKTLDAQGNPQIVAYTNPNTQHDSVNPVTQKPTESLNQAINYFRYVCDIDHASNGSVILTHGIKWTTSDDIEQKFTTVNDASAEKLKNVIFTGDDDYIYNKGDTPVTRVFAKHAFTTKTDGINIIAQTGIVPNEQGYSVIIFEVKAGYKIPVGKIISANPLVRSWSGDISGTPETYELAYEMPAGIYEMTLTSAKTPHDWRQCAIDFATVKDGSIPPETPTPTTPTKPTTIPFVQTLTNCQSNATGNSIARKLNAISLTADTGYTFQSNVQILFYSDGKVLSDYNVDGNNTGSMTIPLNTTKENTITDTMDNVKLIATATPIALSTGYEHNYLITDTELSSFGKDRIWSFASETGVVYDVSPYINNVIELPFNVNLPTTLTAISVGRVQSHVVSHETGTRFVVLDLGNIKVPAKYNNGYDYQNKSVKLYAPFVSPITIDNENVIDKTVHISYKIDISNGDATINLDNQGVLFFTRVSNIASQLPFLNTLKNTIINRDTHFNDNDIRQPYIIVTRETPILNNDYYPTIERGLLSSYNGNVKASLLNNVNINPDELNALQNILETGVNIK